MIFAGPTKNLALYLFTQLTEFTLMIDKGFPHQCHLKEILLKLEI